MYKTHIKKITLLSDHAEIEFIKNLQQTCFNGVYPYKIFPDKKMSEVELAPITIFYGGNGSGKTTLLNIIAEKAHVTRQSAFNSSAFFSTYVNGCSLTGTVPRNSRILTSDDVFDYLLNIRYLNQGIDARRADLFEDYLDKKWSQSDSFSGLDDYERWKECYDAKSKSQSQFVRERLRRNEEMYSNGESALRYFLEYITENAVYLLDEPENSLSIALQQELCEYITQSARHFGCQFILATHSPILLSLPDAVIYDLDTVPVGTRKWTELENVRRYFDFFEAHRSEF